MSELNRDNNEGKRVAVWVINGEEHMMKLSTLAITQLEDQIGDNLISVFNNKTGMPKLKTMLQITHKGLKAYDKDITLDKTYDLFDQYTEAGGSQTEFAAGPFMDLYKASGFFSEKKAELLTNYQQTLNQIL